jgi:hypothetical protein
MESLEAWVLAASSNQKMTLSFPLSPRHHKKRTLLHSITIEIFLTEILENMSEGSHW